MSSVNRKFKVAVLNYPLLNPSKKDLNYRKYFLLDYTNVDMWKVPVYIHIPFCSSICKFCVYNRQVPEASGNITQKYVDALINEIKVYASTPYIRSLKIGAVFFGGGTPTSLSGEQLKSIIDVCKKHLLLEPGTEITVECNIQNADAEKLQQLKEAGVTRVSMGVQTFSSKYRDLLGLRYSGEKVMDWIHNASKYGFDDVSIDLLYGLPGQSQKEWQEDMDTAISLPITHLSLYELIILAESALYNEIKKQAIPNCPSADELYEMYITSDHKLRNSSFKNIIMPEYNRRTENVKFWQYAFDGYGDNLAFGASAYGYINGVTYQNIPSVSDYINTVNDKLSPVYMVSDKITHEQLMERALVLGFRRGYVEKSVFKQNFGCEINQVFQNTLNKMIIEGIVIEEKEFYLLTEKGRYHQSEVSVSFMESTFKNTSALRKQMAVGKHIIPDKVLT